jgi:hypothetical protein
MTGEDLLASLGKLLGTKLQEKIEFRGESTFVILPSDLQGRAFLRLPHRHYERG